MYKSIFLSLFVIGTSLTAEAQTIQFAYDKGGNRCERIVRQNIVKNHCAMRFEQKALRVQ